MVREEAIRSPTNLELDEPVVSITLRRRPGRGKSFDYFDVRETPLADLAASRAWGEVLVRAEAISVDPYVKARLTDRPSYKPPVAIGDLVPGEAVVTVLASDAPNIKPGDMALAHTGWRTHAVVPASALRSLPVGVCEVTHALGVLGMPGLTAYAGLAEFGDLQSGETLVVGAATGAVGSLVGQLAKRKGLRTVGIVSGEEKRRVAIETLGFDEAVDRLSPKFSSALQLACPAGIDVQFETVGGAVFERAFPLFNRRCRVLVCGLVGQWGTAPPGASTARDLLRAVLDKSLAISGFVVGDLESRYRQPFLDEVGPLVATKEIAAPEMRYTGIRRLPEAFHSMLAGDHIGKTIVVRDGFQQDHHR